MKRYLYILSIIGILFTIPLLTHAELQGVQEVCTGGTNNPLPAGYVPVTIRTGYSSSTYKITGFYSPLTPITASGEVYWNLYETGSSTIMATTTAYTSSTASGWWYFNERPYLEPDTTYDIAMSSNYQIGNGHTFGASAVTCTPNSVFSNYSYYFPGYGTGYGGGATATEFLLSYEPNTLEGLINLSLLYPREGDSSPDFFKWYIRYQSNATSSWNKGTFNIYWGKKDFLPFTTNRGIHKDSLTFNYTTGTIPLLTEIPKNDKMAISYDDPITTYQVQIEAELDNGNTYKSRIYEFTLNPRYTSTNIYATGAGATTMTAPSSTLDICGSGGWSNWYPSTWKCVMVEASKTVFNWLVIPDDASYQQLFTDWDTFREQQPWSIFYNVASTTKAITDNFSTTSTVTLGIPRTSSTYTNIDITNIVQNSVSADAYNTYWTFMQKLIWIGYLAGVIMVLL